MQDEQSVTQPSTEKPNKSNPIKSVLLFLIVIVLLLAVAVAAYTYRDNKAKTELSQKQATIDQLSKKVNELQNQSTTSQKTSTDTTTTTSNTNPSASTIENIKAAITSGNTAALEGYMASSVNVVIAASEAAGARTPTQAVSDLSYIKDSKNWNFALDTATLNSFKAGFYMNYFKTNSVVGRASDGKVVVFNFNDQGKINGIFLAASDSLLTQ
ncbi:MAG: hypothetical protein U0491_02700 [Candidatus Saccharimonadales bacterium]